MEVIVRGIHSKISKAELKYAAKWMANLIMPQRVIDDLCVEIEYFEDKVNDATVEILTDEARPRDFLINIDPKLSRRSQLKALAHELVHVKQYATGEWRYTQHEDQFKWQKTTIYSSNTHYYDYPWEIEAFGREYGIYIRYVNHLQKVKKKFHVKRK